MSCPFEFSGPYRIGQLLGRGGMGSVYAAVHEKSGEEVAVKLIAEHVADEMRFRVRFDRETETLKCLQHEGIVRILGVGEEDGRLFYSMEMVHGESLQKRIRRDKRMDWRATINISIQICAALKHAHDAGVFHRDLKPANLILEADDKVKLVDFGISKLYGYEGEQTAEGAILGTADYMAPEQATGKPTTARTDLYALGCVLYAMVAGRPPFVGKRLTEVIEALKRDRPVPLDLVNPELPDELVELVHHLLEKDPQDRPATALVVMNRLKAMQAGLQREQTVVSDGLPTEGGLEPSTNDTNIADDPSSAATGVTQPKGTSSQRPPTVVSHGAEKRASRVSPDQPTIVSGDGVTETPDGQVAKENESETQSSNTHFETVDPDSHERRRFHDRESEGGNWFHVALLVGVISILLASVWWFIDSTKQAGPEELIAVIDDPDSSKVERMQALTNFVQYAQERAGPAGDSRNSEQAGETSKKPYAGHERYAEFYDRWMDAKLTRRVNLLAARQKAGINPPEVLEKGFLNAMKVRHSNPQEARDLIDAWLAVHDNPNEITTADQQEMILLARHQQSRIKPDAKPTRHPDAEKLIKRMTDSVINDPIDEARKLIQGVLKLHAEEEWAEPVREEGERLLNSLSE